MVVSQTGYQESLDQHTELASDAARCRNVPQSLARYAKTHTDSRLTSVKSHQRAGITEVFASPMARAHHLPAFDTGTDFSGATRQVGCICAA
jgi:hypothetical protein